MSITEFITLDLATYLFFYVTLALGFYFFYWIFLKEKTKKFRIQQKQRTTPIQLKSEIIFSLASFVVFAAVDLAAYQLEKSGYTLLYSDVSQKGLLYFCLTPILILIFHDTYFYWMHRLVHTKMLYKTVHLRHHRSVDPSPFASFSFGFYEMLSESFFNILIVFIIPAQFYSLLIFQFLSTLFNVIGHLGYEVYPSGFTKNKFTFWKTTSTHHNMHHEKFNGNYGIYSTFWDRLCGTEFEDYHVRFEKAAIGRAERNASEEKKVG